jgi:hypothetical protein
VPEYPHIVVGAGYLPFESEAQLAAAIADLAASTDEAKLFNEIQDDRYILETALAGSADILVTSDVSDFARGPAILFHRTDVFLFPFAGRNLVVAKPGFAAFWLRQGWVPDAAFIAGNPQDFPLR